MDCRKCKNLIKDGKKNYCIYNKNIVVFGEMGSDPIIEDCGKFEKMEGRKETHCTWTPLDRVKNKDGFTRWIIKTSCGRVLEYSRRTNIDDEIMGEVCTGCGRLIDMNWVEGMEE